ncbi:hypothetical protein ACFFLS_24435 [Flavobacterium procerum]|uniref:C1q domain-containing protein n=1 Tax=Flavobacterium procerum TaxID=1455569 RepID=A0ABV6BXL5_9FLAO
MKRIILILLMIYSGVMMPQAKTVVTQYGEKVVVHPNANNGLNTNNGFVQLGGELMQPTTIKTTGANTLAISDLTVSTDTSDTPIVTTAAGVLKKGAFPSINIIPDDIGTVMAIDGKLEVAQEITALMSTNFLLGVTTGKAIGNITNVLIDNKGTFTGTGTTNSFKVKTDGLYFITINLPILNAGSGTPAIGVYCDTDDEWVTRISSEAKDVRINLTLLTSLSLSAAKTYSFRAAVSAGASATVEAVNSGTTGNGPVAFFSVKRLR